MGERAFPKPMSLTPVPDSGLPSLLTHEQIEAVRLHLDQVLASSIFSSSKRTQEFLRLIVGYALDGRSDDLHERMIGAKLFGRPIGYDTGSDSVVRVRASDARKKLALYYSQLTPGSTAIRIELPSGSYVPLFRFTAAETGQKQPLEAPSHTGAAVEVPGMADHQPLPAAPLARSAARKPLFFSLAVCIVLLASLAGYLGWRHFYGHSEIASLAVLPLDNLSGSPAQDFFADGITEELINTLGQIPTLRVTSLTSSMSYKGSKKKLPEIAHELGVNAVIEGGILKEGSHVRISIQLIDANTDRPIWARTYTRELAEGVDWQGEVAEDIAEEISSKNLPQQQARLLHKTNSNPEVHELYLHGILMRDSNLCAQANDFFQQALAKAPDSSEIYSAMASCYGMMAESGHMPYLDGYTRQRTAAQHAINLDDTNSEAHAERGNSAMTLDWNWNLADAEFKRALALNPSSSTSHEKYAFYLVRSGRPQEAQAEIEQSVALDPVSVSTFHTEAFIDYFSRRYDKALTVLDTARKFNINIADWYFLRGDIYAGQGDYAHAIDAFLKAGDGPFPLGHLGNAYANHGQQAEARKLIDRLAQSVHSSGIGSYEIALIYSGLGDRDQAFAWLDNAARVHDVGLVYLKVDPCLDPLRTDPRFAQLLHRVGLA